MTAVSAIGLYDPALSASSPGFKITACFHSAGIDPSSHTDQCQYLLQCKVIHMLKISHPYLSLPGVVCRPRRIALVSSWMNKNILITSLLSLFLSSLCPSCSSISSLLIRPLCIAGHLRSCLKALFRTLTAATQAWFLAFSVAFLTTPQKELLHSSVLPRLTTSPKLASN